MQKLLKKLSFLSRLWQYNNLYFLKPHDAINDTLTSSILKNLDWSDEILEIGSGDGVFSYIMHGGKFDFKYDRYLNVDLSNKDIYDIHTERSVSTNSKLEYPNITCSLDAKESHVKKILEIGFSKDARVVEYERLPFRDNTIKKVFYYTPHGLMDHKKSIQEVYRILKPGGKLLILLFDSNFKSSFISYHLSNSLPNFLGKYFREIDNGRYEEITKLSKSKFEWSNFFEDNGFEIENTYSGLSTTAWKFYDIQTRFIFKFLIKIINSMPTKIRSIIKLFLVLINFPYQVLFYFIFSNQFLRISSKDCYLAYQLKKRSSI